MRVIILGMQSLLYYLRKKPYYFRLNCITVCVNACTHAHMCVCVCVCVCERDYGGELNQTEVQILLSIVLKNLYADCIVFQGLE